MMSITPSLFGVENHERSDSPPKKKRQPPRGWLPGVRLVEWKIYSTLWQARYWLGPRYGGSVSLGLYRNEREAHAIWRTVDAALERIRERTKVPLPLACWRILRRTPGARKNVLPPWVQRRGTFYVGRKVIGDWLYETPYQATPVMAFESLWSEIDPVLEAKHPEFPVATSYSLFEARIRS